MKANIVPHCVSAFVRAPEWLAVWICVLEAHLLQLAAAVQLVVASVCLLPQVLHVHPDEHLTQLHKVTVALIFHWGETHTHVFLLFQF